MSHVCDLIFIVRLPLQVLSNFAYVCLLCHKMEPCADGQNDRRLQPHAGGRVAGAGLCPESSGFLGAATVLPVDSALICRDILRIIFEKLPVPDLARASCVCRLWYSLASDGEIQTAAFKAPWKLKDVVGNPTSGCFWRDNGLAKFAISHRISKGDSVASLAVKYDVQVMDIRRLNNMMSDHGIYSRERLLIPVSSPKILASRTCYIEVDRHAKREVAVVYLDGCPEERNQAYSVGSGGDHGRRRVVESLRRSMQVDDGTALYYLSISNGNPRAAMSEFSEDLCWERRSGTV